MMELNIFNPFLFKTVINCQKVYWLLSVVPKTKNHSAVDLVKTTAFQFLS